MFKYVVILCLFFSFSLSAKESLLTLKQQLDRLQREVSDLSQSVFQGSRDQSFKITQDTSQSTNLTAFDLRIYDLEKDIKKLNENFEEIIFQIDDLKKLYEQLKIQNSAKLLNQNNSENLVKENNTIVSLEEPNNTLLDEENNKNILGSLIINSKDLSNISEQEVLVLKKQDKKQDNTLQNIIELKPEEEFQKAFDMIRNQQFFEAKQALENFISKYQDDELSGTAHYWLGEIYLLKKEYRDAALIFAEGYQKFPISYKAPDMLFKLSTSLIIIDKKKDACNTLEKLINEFPKHKLANKAEKKLNSFDCINAIQ